MLYSKWWIVFSFFVHTGRNESFSSVKFIRGKVLWFILPVFLCHTLVYTAAILIEKRFTPVVGIDQTKNSVSLLPLRHEWLKLKWKLYIGANANDMKILNYLLIFACPWNAFVTGEYKYWYSTVRDYFAYVTPKPQTKMISFAC